MKPKADVTVSKPRLVWILSMPARKPNKKSFLLKMPFTNSNSAASLNITERASYLWELFKMRYKERGKFDNSARISRIQEYTDTCSRHNIDLKQSQILEIGIGQRPYLGITLVGLGYNYLGVDLDQPVYPPSIQKFAQIFHENGALRSLKTLFRYFLFDRAEYSALFNSLNLSPDKFISSEVFIQSNAAHLNLSDLLSQFQDHKSSHGRPQTPLVVVSESALEHIPVEDLEQILQNLVEYARSTNRQILLLLRPSIFTGITGSHLTEWYYDNVYSTAPKRSEPWEHLRKNRFQADTYLNRLSRSDYRSLFARNGLRLVNETVEHPGLGAEFLLDKALRKELVSYHDDELLSNEVMFELTINME